MVIALGVEFSKETIPRRSDLQSIAGRIVGSGISSSKGKIYAEIKIRGDSGNVILYQWMPQELAARAVQAPLGTAVSALIAKKKSTDAGTGLERLSVWQLSVGDAPIVSYEELWKFHSFEATGWRVFASSLGAAGVICLAVLWLRRRSRANP